MIKKTSYTNAISHSHQPCHKNLIMWFRRAVYSRPYENAIPQVLTASRPKLKKKASQETKSSLTNKKEKCSATLLFQQNKDFCWRRPCTLTATNLLLLFIQQYMAQWQNLKRSVLPLASMITSQYNCCALLCVTQEQWERAAISCLIVYPNNCTKGKCKVPVLPPL